MKLDLKFTENNKEFKLDFGQIQDLSDGGFERGYEAGYEQGRIDFDTPTQEKTVDIIANGMISVAPDEGYALSNVTVNVNVEASGGGADIEDALITKNVVGDYANDRVETIGQQVFRDQAKLTSVNFPIVTRIGDYSFAGCTSMAEASLPLVTRIDSYAFLDCNTLEKADFPLVSDVYGYAFRNCYMLSEVNLPLVAEIKDCTFDMPLGTNNVLTKLDFPKVTSIKALAFRRCTALTALILRADSVVTLGNANAFTTTPIESGTGHIYVPDNLVERYKAATNWVTYANQIKPLSELEG